MVKEINNTESI